ncbi:MAG TPA: gamma-glutamyl-gamma-aminobutyrate hydrolase family protein [Dermatophilaceae bacterium]|jgi:putative glutamine amidotransferase|nr:gamma-glutamyl-gamma-aminobutyrate hydrolase family protein [Dermatophilaceae bacterium]
MSGARRETRRPVIGISCYVNEVDRPPWRAEPTALLPRVYLDHVAEAGGIPVILPPSITDARDESAAQERARQTLERVDGLILAGGEDVDPSRYAALPHPQAQPPDPDRDAWELTLARVSAEVGIPVLGVCRGLQIMAVAAGGTLDQHLPDTVGTDQHLATPGVFTRHTVQVAAGSSLGRIVGSGEQDVPAYHHQAVARLRGYQPSAWATDGVVEAFEDPRARFRLAVQWHPEVSGDLTLVRGLVAAAAEWSASRDALSRRVQA